jgi:hypothetical protein
MFLAATVLSVCYLQLHQHCRAIESIVVDISAVLPRKLFSQIPLDWRPHRIRFNAVRIRSSAARSALLRVPIQTVVRVETDLLSCPGSLALTAKQPFLSPRISCSWMIVVSEVPRAVGSSSPRPGPCTLNRFTRRCWAASR